VLDRFPVLVWLGATLLGWIAGDVIETDPAIHPLLQRIFDGQITSGVFGISQGELVEYIASILGAFTVLIVGSVWRRRKLHHAEHLA
jgi:hypothetical protein